MVYLFQRIVKTGQTVGQRYLPLFTANKPTKTPYRPKTIVEVTNPDNKPPSKLKPEQPLHPDSLGAHFEKALTEAEILKQKYSKY